MLGTARLVTFALRAVVLLLLVSLLWIGVAKHYNQALAAAAGPLLLDGSSVRVLGAHLLFEHPGLEPTVSIDGFTLHYGLVLMVVLVLAAVGIGTLPRLGWLAAMAAGAFLTHVVGVALLARGLAWAAGADSPVSAGRLVFSLFAVFWGLLPAIASGVWCWAYWLPRAAGHPTRFKRERSAPGAGL